jgi:hypothetical protein
VRPIVEGWVRLPGTRRKDAFPQILAISIAVDLITFFLALFATGLVRARAELLAAEVNVGLGKLRSGSKVVDVENITRAWLDTTRGPQRTLDLRLGTSSGLEIVVPLLDGEESKLYTLTRECLLQILPRTSITLPTDRYDPHGRFIRMTFPSNLTKDEAIAVLTRPPRPGEPLPIFE